jgi:hypothetical protein
VEKAATSSIAERYGWSIVGGYLLELVRRSKLWTALSTLSTVSTFLPFLHGENVLRYALIAIAVFSFLAANFLLYKDQRSALHVCQSDLDEFRSEVSRKGVFFRIESAIFRVSSANNKVVINIQVIMEIRNTGPSTRLRLKEADVYGIPLEPSMQAFLISSNRRTHESSMEIFAGDTDMVTASMHLTCGSATQSIVQDTMRGYLLFDETHRGLMKPIEFHAHRES